MVPIQAIRDSNLRANSLVNLVAVFVGGTHGIAETTIRELFLRATSPRAYIIGRDEDKGNKLVEELVSTNPGSQAIYMKADISSLRTVDRLCEELQQAEKKINILFLSAGYMSLKGRTVTSEGLDHKMAVNYYSRIRFTTNLMPQLKAASDDGEISRVCSVLAAGSEADIDLDDLDLVRHYTLHACLAHCVMMTDFMLEELSKRHPGTSFSHSYPGTVKTGITKNLSGPVRLGIKVLYSVMTPWILNFRESGERHLFQLTNAMYPPRVGGGGLPLVGGMEVVHGTDGVQGSGAYLLDWDGKPTGDSEIVSKYRELNAGSKIYEHTMQMFKKATTNKRRAEEEEASNKRKQASTAPNPVGWRSA